MRVVLIDTNVESSNVIYPLEVMQPFIKGIEKLTLVKTRTSEEDVQAINPDNILGYIDHIKPYKGVFRGDVTTTSPEEEAIVEKHLEDGGRIRLALEITGTKTNEVITITQVHEMYYAFLEDIGEE